MAILIPHFDLAEKIGGGRFEMDANNIDELIREGTSRFGEPFAQAVKSATILVNGRQVSRLKGKKTTLAKGDTVWLVVPSGGG
jgi:molybdopterin converting factor small subunit